MAVDDDLPLENQSTAGARPHPQAVTTPSMNAIKVAAESASIKIRCTQCSATYTTLKNALGKLVRCRKCRTEFIAAAEE